MKAPIKTLALILFLPLLCCRLFAQNPNYIVGVYYVVDEDSKEESKIRIYKKGNCYEGQVIWLQETKDKNGNTKIDSKNPDPNMRQVTCDRLIIIKELKYNEKKNRWEDGKIYNPLSGKYYDVMAEFKDPKTLKITGYLGIKALSRSIIWEKID